MFVSSATWVASVRFGSPGFTSTAMHLNTVLTTQFSPRHVVVQPALTLPFRFMVSVYLIRCGLYTESGVVSHIGNVVVFNQDLKKASEVFHPTCKNTLHASYPITRVGGFAPPIIIPVTS